MSAAMTPSTSHRLLSVPSNTRLYLNWPIPKVPVGRRIYRALFGGAVPVKPNVDPVSFHAAFRMLDTNPEISAEGFRALGYTVTVEPNR